jgi:WD40 repeat protein
VLAAAFSPDGTRVVTVSGGRTATVWNVSTGNPVGEPLKHAASVVSAMFSPDGRQVITASEDGTARVWNAASGVPAGTEMNQNARVVSAALDGSGAHLVMLSANYALLWDVEARRQISQRLDHREESGPPVFSTDGHVLITMPLNVAAADLRDVHHGLRVLGQLRHETNPVAAAASRTGLLLTASQDGTVHLWDIGRRVEVSVPLRHQARLRSAAISADGSRILVVEDGEGIAWTWDVLTGSASDAETLANAAEVIGGYFIDGSGELTEMPARIRQERLASLRERSERLTGGGSPAESFVRWLLSDPATRTVSPLSRIAVPDYIRVLLSEGESGRREAHRLFPGHAALAAARGSESGAAGR